jgi:hypothetical protein
MRHGIQGGVGKVQRPGTSSMRSAALALAAGLAAAAAGAPPAIASAEVPRPAATTATETPAGAISATETAAPRPAILRLRVAPMIEGGRLVVKLAERVILSTPLATFAGVDGRPRERDLSLPEGRHALTVQMLDALGRVVAKGNVSGYAGGTEPATLEVADRPGPGAGLTLIWRTP